ncbi:hypothetical protein pphageT12_58 [Pseudomonas phage pphageT12]|nr:hypothetical protein pphageT12_58 [Pseudomonas phage pphageT12]
MVRLRTAHTGGCSRESGRWPRREANGLCGAYQAHPAGCAEGRT